MCAKKFIHAIAITVATVGLNLLPIGAASPVYASSESNNAEIHAKRNGPEVSLDWRVTAPNSRVKLIRDGKVLQDSAIDGQFIDTIPANVDADYELYVTRPLSNLDLNQVSDLSRKVDMQRNPLQYEVLDILGIRVSQSLQGGVFMNTADASASASSTTLRYQTFIPEGAFLPVIPNACGYKVGFFKGDDRKFSTSETASFRTRFDVTADWVSSGSLSSSKKVGATKIYIGDFLVASKTASNSSMQLTQKSTSKSKVEFNFTQNVGNPFCMSNGIFFDFNVVINRGGSYSLSGTRLRAPNHEIYIKDSDQSKWTSIMEEPFYSLLLDCLAPGLSGIVGCNTNDSISGTR